MTSKNGLIPSIESDGDEHQPARRHAFGRLFDSGIEILEDIRHAPVSSEYPGGSGGTPP
jgi:hypothetical protein